MAYAVIKTGGKQYKVAAGDTIDVEKLDLEPGTETTFSDVLFYVDGAEIKLGSGTVVAEVVAQRKDAKVIAYKYRRRKGYHRTVGHRRRLTRLKIKSVAA
jgi:large subunit ribosomal protein L21